MSQHQWADRPGVGGGCWRGAAQSPVAGRHTHIHTCILRVLISLLHSTPRLSRIRILAAFGLDRVNPPTPIPNPPHPGLTQKTDWRDQKPVMKACTEARGGLLQRGNLCHTTHHPPSPQSPPPSLLVAPGRHATHFHQFSSGFSAASVASFRVNEKAAGASRLWSHFISVGVDAGG